MIAEQLSSSYELSNGNGPVASEILNKREGLLLHVGAPENLRQYGEFAIEAASGPPIEIHDLFELASCEPIPLSEVKDSVWDIAARFSTGAMSLGALSPEAHGTLTEAMNTIGAKSNCGEGGEDTLRFGTIRSSRIKQIASARFGVTAWYCADAKELNIKMAQGSKPGEGGYIPPRKVTKAIADLRHTQEGVGLISPPPHHDIYSIEDLAQLIYDLKQVNTEADVSVKLVAEENIGTIAAGVVKAGAEIVQISGYNGGTGASPLSSIKHAGMPWEVGLVDAQHTLIENGLRDRVRLRVDGGFKTGHDVVMAALLGADEFSFGTAAMMAEGCIMLRQCHTNKCVPGIATQDPKLRQKFKGTPENVANYMLFIAEDVRQHLAWLGLRTFDEAIGRVDLLSQALSDNPRINSLDLSPLLKVPEAADDPRRFVRHLEIQRQRSELDETLLNDAHSALESGEHIDHLSYTITNVDRTIGASLGGFIGKKWGEQSPPGSVRAHFEGSAGQSFGAFLGRGVTLDLEGEANDYVGKSLSGGRIVIRPSKDEIGDDPVLAGNVVLFGATEGQIFVAGKVGQRFALRNSGATAVAEGAGWHACEYMTGGTVVLLGDFGPNLGSGMTGGEIFVYNPKEHLASRLNLEYVETKQPGHESLEQLHNLIKQHHHLTGSSKAAEVLENWVQESKKFWHVVPISEETRMERASTALTIESR